MVTTVALRPAQGLDGASFLLRVSWVLLGPGPTGPGVWALSEALYMQTKMRDAQQQWLATTWLCVPHRVWMVLAFS